MAYANGSGGWCGCNCNCCPPQPLYKTVTVVFSVGTPYDEWAGPPPDDGCECGPVTSSLRAKNLPKLQALPAFGQEDFLGSDDGMFVFALSAGGCIPCETVSVTLSTTGLGFWISGSDIHMVGSGSVTAIAAPSSKTGCGTLTPKVNGSPSYSGSDGDVVVATLDVGTSTWGCSACIEGFSGTSMMAMKLGEIQQLQRKLRRRATTERRAALQERIKKTSLPLKPASQPRQTSP